MINIIKDRDLLQSKVKAGYDYISMPYKAFSSIIAYEGGISDSIKHIIEIIDGCRVDNNNVISKFTDTPIELSKVSDGCKTAAYIYFRTLLIPSDKEIVNITECGPNAIKYILENYGNTDINLYMTHSEFPNNVDVAFTFNDNIKINNTKELFGA